MDKIIMQVTGNSIKVMQRPAVITSGTVGLPIEFSFDSQWDGLHKLAVFRAGQKSVTVDIMLVANLVVPWEVLEEPNLLLSIGAYGTNWDDRIVIPTLWGDVGMIRTGTDPEADPAVDPTAPVWQDALVRINAAERNMEQFQTREDVAAEVQHFVELAGVVFKNEFHEVALNNGFVEQKELGDVSEQSANHIADLSNPHKVTCEQIGAVSKRDLTEAVAEHEGNQKNPHYVTAEQIGAATVSSLESHIGDTGNPHGVTAEQIGAAPAGYGLGESSASAQAWNGAARNGFYRSNTHSPDGEWWYGINCKYDSNIAAQIAFKRVSDAGDPMVMAIRHRPTYQSANPWLEWEYVNPPFMEGVEYRTIERRNGKAVYKKLVGDTIYWRVDGSDEWKQ